jgi:hypothetical protein
MKGGLVIVAVLAVLVLGIGGWVVGNYNGLVSKKADVEKSLAEVDNLLQRRNDLIPNLVETVKGIAAQEQTVFGEIANARAAMAGAKTTEQKFAAGQQMDASGRRRHRELPAAQVAGELPPAAGRARGNGEPVVGRALALQRARGVQHAGQELPDEPVRGHTGYGEAVLPDHPGRDAAGRRRRPAGCQSA